MQSSVLCYRSPGLDRVFSLIFQLESKSLVSQALSFLLSSPDPSSNQVCAQHIQFNVGTDCSDSRACPCFAFCLLASSRLPISCSCLWFSCLCDRTDGIFSFFTASHLNVKLVSCLRDAMCLHFCYTVGFPG